MPRSTSPITRADGGGGEAEPRAGGGRCSAASTIIDERGHERQQHDEHRLRLAVGPSHHVASAELAAGLPHPDEATNTSTHVDAVATRQPGVSWPGRGARRAPAAAPAVGGGGGGGGVAGVGRLHGRRRYRPADADGRRGAPADRRPVARYPRGVTDAAPRRACCRSSSRCGTRSTYIERAVDAARRVCERDGRRRARSPTTS